MPRDWRLAGLALGVVWGCYMPGALPRNEEVVTTRLSWVDVSQVPRVFLRLGSQPYVGPYFVLVSQSGHYCAVPDVVFVTVREHDRWACDWQPQRPA